MKTTSKTYTLILAAALTLSAASCGNSPAQTTAAQTQASETSQTTTAAAETQTAPGTTAAPETTTERSESETSVTALADEPDDAEKTLLYTAKNGEKFYAEDAASAEEWGMYRFDDKAVMALSTGFYTDSSIDPGNFNADEYQYNGDKPAPGELVTVRAGDKWYGTEVSEVETYIQGATEYSEGYLFSNSVKFAGDVTLTGVMRYYYDEQYGIGSGDIIFLPDSSIAGMPVPIDAYSDNTTTLNFDWIGNGEDWDNLKLGDAVSVFTDAPQIRLGNYYETEGYNKNSAITDIVNGGGDNLTKFVRVTISDLMLSYSDQFGTSHSWGTIRDIEEIEAPTVAEYVPLTEDTPN